MKRKMIAAIVKPALALIMIPAGMIIAAEAGKPLIIDHRHTDLASLSDADINLAVKKLRIMYGHTSHGKQVMKGLIGLRSFDRRFADLPPITDGTIGGARDLGQPDRIAWVQATRDYLKSNPDTNVVMWSWCGQVSRSSREDIATYLSNMSRLERDSPSVIFVYMTGHLDGSGTKGNLHQRNEQIRSFCRKNGKVLYDFADIESYDPDGREYLSRGANDNCDYDSDGDCITDRNWAEEWQKANPGRWYRCPCPHSKPLNGNMKAAAAWHLFTELAARIR